MIDKTETEERAFVSVLHPLGEIATEIGLDKSLANYTREEVLTLIEGVVDAYQKYGFENLPVQPQPIEPTPLPDQPQPKGVPFNDSRYA